MYAKFVFILKSFKSISVFLSSTSSIYKRFSRIIDDYESLVKICIPFNLVDHFSEVVVFSNFLLFIRIGSGVHGTPLLEKF